MIEITKSLFVLIGVVITAYLSFMAAKYSRQGKNVAEHELRENSGNSAVDKIRFAIEDSKRSIQGWISSFETRVEFRLGSMERRINSLDRREASNSDRIDRLEELVRRKDKTS